MWKPLIRCTIIGGIVVFIWSMFSWVVLPMHSVTINQFTEPAEVEACLTRYAPLDGVYVTPDMDAKAEERAGKSFIFVNMRRGLDLNSIAGQLTSSIITQMIGAFLITYLLLRAKVSKYWNRVWFITAIGAIAGILGSLPLWTWWHFPGMWTFLQIFDLVVGWFIGGLVIAKLSKN